MKVSKRQIKIRLFLVFVASIALVSTVVGQVRAVNDYGALGLGRLLKELNTTASVMMIGAHPDDEDSALLAYLARGENARTAYLSLTRGDGGQNIIGPELFESLGVIRTEELLQARRLDGAEQYFARAFDYGFSKTLAEAKQKWPEEVIKCDVVRAIRSFRPLVVISRFSGTPADGHGHHQYSGYITPIAVKAAADPQQCTQSGMAWQVMKLYSGIANQPSLRVNTGQFDTMLGRSYAEIAIEGRSQHRSQGEGRIEVRGERFSGLNLLDSKVPKVEKETSVFDGVDTSVTGIPKLVGFSLPEIVDDLPVIQKSSEAALRDFRPSDPKKIAPVLIDGLKATRNARAKLARVLKDGHDVAQDSDIYLALKESEFSMALASVFGITVDALSDKETVVPGDDLLANVNVYFPKDPAVIYKESVLKAPTGWTVTKAAAPASGPQGFGGRDTPNQAEYFAINVAKNASLTQPYWLTDPRDGDLFRWPDIKNQTLPFQSQPLVGQATVQVNGLEITIERPVQYRYADPARGEIRREINVVPAISVKMGKPLIVVRSSANAQSVRLTMTITNELPRAVSGKAFLNLSASGFSSYTGGGQPFEIKNIGQKATLSFDVEIPAAEPSNGTHFIVGYADIPQGGYRFAARLISYPHIQTHRIYEAAMTQVAMLDLKTAPVKIGYIMGSGDEVPEAIRQMGLDVTMLEEKDLASGDLTKYDTIVVGIRASETRPDFVANNQRLMEYVKNGGNLIVQYQRGNFAQRGLTPYPVDTTDKQGTAAGSIARVVDENAPVKILQPGHAVFNFPNKITDDDFKGWLQERNAYNLETFDERYVPLLESHDAGEAENKGGLVTAQIGKGTWTYCSYSFFRQLPAGVGGAYRLFANLLSMPKSTNKG